MFSCLHQHEAVKFAPGKLGMWEPTDIVDGKLTTVLAFVRVLISRLDEVFPLSVSLGLSRSLSLSLARALLLGAPRAPHPLSPDFPLTCVARSP